MQGNCPATHLADFQRTKRFDEFVVLIIEAMFDQNVVFADNQYFLAPNDSGIFMRYGLDFINGVSVAIRFTEQVVIVLVDDVVGPGNVLVGKIGAHPTLAHHR